jgi:hypothetical protein
MKKNSWRRRAGKGYLLAFQEEMASMCWERRTLAAELVELAEDS